MVYVLTYYIVYRWLQYNHIIDFYTGSLDYAFVNLASLLVQTFERSLLLHYSEPDMLESLEVFRQHATGRGL